MRRGSAAALLLLLSLVVTVDMSCIRYRERSEENTWRMYVEWMVQYDRTYNIVGEMEYRYQVFKNNLCYIDRHNAAVDAEVYSCRLGLNGFADLTTEEYRSTYLGRHLSDTQSQRCQFRVNPGRAQRYFRVNPGRAQRYLNRRDRFRAIRHPNPEPSSFDDDFDSLLASASQDQEQDPKPEP